MSNTPFNSSENNNKIRSANSFARLLNWSGLSYPQKFTVVAIIFALPLIAFAPLIADRFTRIDQYGYKEAQGAVYLRQVWQLADNIQLFHSAVIRYENGVGSPVQIKEAESKVETNFSTLSSTSELYDADLGIDFNINELQAIWDHLKTSVQNEVENGHTNLDNSEGKSDHDADLTALTDGIEKLTKEVGDKSYLILDPDLDTYYMMDTVLIKLPENQLLIFELWHATDDVIVHQNMSPAELFKLDSLISRIEVNLLNMEQSIQTAIQSNSGGFMRPIVTAPFQSYLTATRSFTSEIRTHTLGAQTSQISSEDVYASFNNASESGNIFYQAASQALDMGLQRRIASSNLRLYTSIILAALSVLAAYLIGISMMRSINRPLLELISATEKLTAGEMSTRITATSADEVGRASLAFNKMAEDLEKNRITLRTSAVELERRSLELEIIAEVGRDIAVIRDLNTLLNVAANLIRERFNYYHVGIFLVDGNNEFAHLRAVSGEAAEKMLEKNYKVQIGQGEVVGNVIRTGRAIIALDTGTNAVHFENPFLPDAHSEISLPLRSHNITIGALDIQANTTRAFDERNTQTLQILADQLAAAIENAELVQQVEGTLNELTNANRLQSQQAWRSAIVQKERPAYEYDGLQIRSVPQDLPSDLLIQLENGKPVVVRTNSKYKEDKNTLIIPLMVLNQIIGVIGLEQENSNHLWTDEEIAIAQAAANRAALTLENARLLEESQRRAIKERTIFEATARIGSAVNIENILQTTAEELERVLSGSEVILQFQSDNESKDENNRSR